MTPYAGRRSGPFPNRAALRGHWLVFRDRYIATEAPADLDQIEAAIDAEPPGLTDAILLAVATFVTVAWAAFLIALLVA